MICDHIKYASAYFNLSPGIRRALEYLSETNLGALAEGRHAIDGDRIFALVSDYDTREPSETFWEAHRRHVDVQYVVKGEECIGYGDLATFTTDPYDSERDLVVAHGDSGSQLTLGAGGFAILFPHDVHMPGLTHHSIRAVRKVVVKVRLDEA